MKKYVIEQSGRSMIEMLGVLAIVGVLSVAGIAGYSKAMAKYKANKLIDQVSTVAANVRTTFAGQGNYKGLDDGTAYSLGIFPEEVSKDCDINGAPEGDGSDCLHNAFGGMVTVLASPDNDKFDVGVDGISKDACSTLVLADWGSASAFHGIAVLTDPSANAATGDADDAFYTISDIKQKPMEIVTQKCTCSSTENNCVVVFRFM